MRYSKHWMGLTLGFLIGAFLILGYFGREAFQQAPPIPRRVVTGEGRVLFAGSDILEGQRVWQSMGGQEVGSIWGHGAYVAPDWTADWLHRQAAWLLEHWAESEHATAYGRLGAEAQAALRARLQELLHTNTYNPATHELTLPPVLAEAAEAVGQHYAALFGDNPAFQKLRQAYALPERTITDPDKQASLNAFLFWAAWACTANRPGAQVSYTQNWPPDELVGNRPPGTLLFWTVASVVLLLAGIGVLGFYYAAVHIRHQGDAPPPGAEREALLTMAPTPSMRATRKFFRTAVVLFVMQVALGALTAFYGMKGTTFYGLLSAWLFCR
jgi:nitric oxide reductase subunit B